jgi:hypothetical protein
VSKSVALLLVLVFLTASCLMAKPAFSSPSGVAENTWTRARIKTLHSCSRVSQENLSQERLTKKF